MKLLYTKRSPYARKVLVTAIEKKIKLELIEENLTNKSPNLLTHNPLGKIPTLILDDDTSICDSSLICEYLDGLEKSPVLIPSDPKKRLDVLKIDAIAKGLADNAVAVYYEKAILHPKDFNQSFIDGKEAAIIRTLEYFDQHISDLKEFNMAAISIACAVGYTKFRLEHLWPPKNCKNLIKWFEEVSQRESLRQTIPTA
ncbi:MAG: glutathione S-transferase N-terminal domain-containing protein [Candidatus Omnitrophica bacterium]|nr:glutathione S-transferase N-terminal domain-containing protein [Candidatus Omnitrophota bacterium]